MYATIDDLKQHMAENQIADLSDDSVPAAEMDAALVEHLLADASGIVDGWLAGRYAVPLAPPAPAMVRVATLDIARQMLFARRLGEVPAAVDSAYKRTIAWLQAVARGTVRLDGVTATPSLAGLTPGNDRIFRRDQTTYF